MNMGKQQNIRMECPCLEKEAEAEKRTRPKRYLIQKLQSGWYEIWDREKGISVNEMPLRESEANYEAEKLNDNE